MLDVAFVSAVKDLFENGRIFLDDLEDAVQICRLYGSRLELARNRSHWIVFVRDHEPERKRGA